MSYGGIGAPRPFNGTNPVLGCDSGTRLVLPSSFSISKALELSTPTDRQNAAHEQCNTWFQSGDQAYIIIGSAMVFLMVPGLGFLYSGLARRKSALSMIWACMMAYTVINFQWYFWGYSLAFSRYATNGYIGDLNQFGLMKVLALPSPGSPLIPDLLYSFYQVRGGSDTQGKPKRTC